MTLLPAIDLIVIPFHDWSKGLREGFRTRDGHLLQHIVNAPEIRRVLVIEKPRSLLDALVHRERASGEVYSRLGACKELRWDEKVTILQRNSPWAVLSHIAARGRWYVAAYGREDLLCSALRWIRREDTATVAALSFNVLAADLCHGLRRVGIPTVFDAFDDLTRFIRPPVDLDSLDQLYRTYAKVSQKWTTNSEANRSAFVRRYGVEHCEIVRNGVDSAVFEGPMRVPDDLRRVPRPWVGFGGKISHLVDRRLLVDVADRLPSVSIVVIGQRLRGEAGLPRGKHANIWYLGDKHYLEYPKYVCNWDVCIMPYVSGSRGHGGDAIKLYEYMAARKPIVSTPGNGTDGLEEWISLASTAEEFAGAIRHALEHPAAHSYPSSRHEWMARSESIMRMLRGAARSEGEFRYYPERGWNAMAAPALQDAP